MKDYKRLTEKCYSCPVCENGKCLEPQYNCEEKEECEAWNRLFEIENKIESGELCKQKTCKNISEKNPVDEFICSECGFHYEDVAETKYDEDGEYSYFVEFVTKYCPNCGAKVEE